MSGFLIYCVLITYLKKNNFNLKSISINFIYRFIPMVRSLKADGAIALMDVQEQVSLPLHSHFIKKSLKMSQWGKK